MTPPPCYTTRQQWNRHAYVTLLYLTQLSEVQALVKMALISYFPCWYEYDLNNTIFFHDLLVLRLGKTTCTLQ